MRYILRRPTIRQPKQYQECSRGKRHCHEVWTRWPIASYVQWQPARKHPTKYILTKWDATGTGEVSVAFVFVWGWCQFELLLRWSRRPVPREKIWEVLFAQFVFRHPAEYIFQPSPFLDIVGFAGGEDVLERTGNAKMNSSTHLVPATEFLEERKHLLPYRVEMNEPECETREYNVRKDNTLL